MHYLKAIFRNAGIIFVMTLALYGMIFLLSYVIYPQDLIKGSLDTHLCERTVFFFQHRYALLAPYAIRPDNRQKLFLIGSSQVEYGFRPEELSPLFADREVHNLAVMTSNISQTRDVFENLEEAGSSKIDWSKTTVVFGIFYGAFVDDQYRYHGRYNHIGREKLRSGLYEERGGKLMPRFPQKYFWPAIVALRPVFFIANRVHVFQDRVGLVRDFFIKWITKGKFDLKTAIDGNRPYPVIDEKYKADALKFWKNFMSSSEDRLSEEQFIVLRDFIVKILGKGSRLIIVDMPLPRWHRDNSVFFKLCRERLQRCFAGIDQEKFSYIDLSASMPDDYFLDSVHPFPAMTCKWAELLAENIRRKELEN